MTGAGRHNKNGIRIAKPTPKEAKQIEQQWADERDLKSPGYEKWWSKLVRKQCGNRCVECGGTANLTAHHILDRKRFPWLKHDRHNGILLCRVCHDQKHEERF